MFSSLQSLTRATLFISVITASALSACATKPDRKGPPPDDRRSGQPSRASGVFLHPVAALFVSMDANQNKIISRAELTTGIAEEWSGFDRNPSAVYFTPWLMENLGAADATPNLISFDRDFNGVITREEFSQGLDREFTRLDKNSDGNLERSEMIVSVSAPQGQRSRKNGDSGGRERGRGQGQGGRPPR